MSRRVFGKTFSGNVAGIVTELFELVADDLSARNVVFAGGIDGRNADKVLKEGDHLALNFFDAGRYDVLDLWSNSGCCHGNLYGSWETRARPRAVREMSDE